MIHKKFSGNKTQIFGTQITGYMSSQLHALATSPHVIGEWCGQNHSGSFKEERLLALVRNCALGRPAHILGTTMVRLSCFLILRMVC